MRLPLFLLTAVLGASLSAPDLLAQSKKGLWKPPIAVSTNVSVWRGERIQITLRGFQGNNPVEYVIANSSRHGALSTVTQPDPDRVSLSTDGSVIYSHDNSDESMSDEFTFRARAVRGGGVSAPATVRINIMDRPPVLAAPAVLDFQAAAGESMTLQLGLTNAGGGFLQIDCRTKPPFEIIGNQVIELPRGASTNVLVRYAPEVAGEAAREVIRPGINDSTGAQIILVGKALAPFEVGTAGDEFILDSKARLSTATLVSRATEPQKVTITAEPTGLVEITPSPVQLEPGASEPITILIPAERKGERQDVKITLATPFHRREFALVAPPVPADLKLLTGTLDFTEGRSGTLTVANSGGVTGSFRLLPVRGLAFSNGTSVDAREFEVEPDKEASVDLILDLPAGVEPPGELAVELGNGAPERIAILAPTPAPRPSPTVSPTITPPPPPPERKAWKLNTDIRVADQEGGPPSLEWRIQSGKWQELQLEIYREGQWETYEPPAPPRGILHRFGDWISGFFGGLVRDRDVTPTNDEPLPVAEWTEEPIDIESANAKEMRWRLTARNGSSGRRQAVSEEFTIDWDEKILAKARPVEEPAPTPEPSLTPPPSTAPVTGSRPLTPALKVESARADSRRDSATVQVIFARDPEADSYRLEHGFHPTLLDQTTGLPYAGDFRTAPHPTAQVAVVGVAETEYEGRELTVLVAEIEGLDAGTSTTWRVVTTADGKDRWPSGEFIVNTLPPWQFPWRQAILVAAFLALAGVLFLRWHINRAPR